MLDLLHCINISTKSHPIPQNPIGYRRWFLPPANATDTALFVHISNTVRRARTSLDGARTIEKISAERSIYFSNGSRRSAVLRYATHISTDSTRQVSVPLHSTETQSATADGSYRLLVQQTPRFLCISAIQCAGQDSNLRSLSTVGLQPTAFDHSATDAIYKVYHLFGK